METSKFYLAGGSLRACPSGKDPDRNLWILIIISLLLCCLLQAPKWISINEIMLSWSAFIDFNFALHGISHQSSLFIVPPFPSIRTKVTMHLTRPSNPVTLWDSFFQDFRKSCTVGSNSCVHWIGQEEWAGSSAIPPGKIFRLKTNNFWGSSTSPNKTSNHFAKWLYMTWIGGHWRFPTWRSKAVNSIRAPPWRSSHPNCLEQHSCKINNIKQFINLHLNLLLVILWTIQQGGQDIQDVNPHQTNNFSHDASQWLYFPQCEEKYCDVSLHGWPCSGIREWCRLEVELILRLVGQATTGRGDSNNSKHNLKNDWDDSFTALSLPCTNHCTEVNKTCKIHSNHLFEATKCRAAKRKTTWLERMVCQFSAILYDMGQVWNTKVWTRGSVFTNLQLLSPCVQAPAWQQPIQAPTFSRVIKNKSWWFNYCYPTFQPLDWSLTIEEHIVSPCFTFVNQEGQWQRVSIFHDSMCTWRHQHPPWENMDSVRTLSDQESLGEAALWPSSRVVRCFNHRFAPWIRQQRVDHEDVSMTCSTKSDK